MAWHGMAQHGCMPRFTRKRANRRADMAVSRIQTQWDAAEGYFRPHDSILGSLIRPPNLIGRLQAWRPALRREQREQLSARVRRSVDVGGSKGAVPGGLGNGANGAAGDGRPAYPSPFSLYSSPLAALDTTTADNTGAPGAEQHAIIGLCRQRLPAQAQGLGRLTQRRMRPCRAIALQAMLQYSHEHSNLCLLVCVCLLMRPQRRAIAAFFTFTLATLHS